MKIGVQSQEILVQWHSISWLCNRQFNHDVSTSQIEAVRERHIDNAKRIRSIRGHLDRQKPHSSNRFTKKRQAVCKERCLT